jgi:hypothetical protein
MFQKSYQKNNFVNHICKLTDFNENRQKCHILNRLHTCQNVTVAFLRKNKLLQLHICKLLVLPLRRNSKLESR